MQLFSTKMSLIEDENGNIINPEVQQLDFDSIFAKGWGNRIKSLLIASAFTDVDFINEVIDKLREKEYANTEGRLAIFLDENASHYFSNEKIRESLDKCSRRIRDSRNHFNEDSGIFLVKCGALFHSKFFISESNTDCRIVLGSANFTKKAFEKNEEIAIAFDAATEGNAKANKLINALKKYVETLDAWKIGTPREKNIKSISVRDLFLKGRLYRDAKEQDPLRMSLNLPDEYLELLDARKKRNTMDDIFDYLESKTLNSLPLATIISRAKLDLPEIFVSNEKRKRSSWKNYCIESCFGFWSPEKYIEGIEKSLDDVSGNKKGKIKDLLDFVDNHYDALQNSFVESINKIQLDRRNIDAGTWAWDSLNNVEDIKEKWKIWWEKVSTKLSDEKYEEFRNRLCRGVAYSCVPDLWDDPLSTEEFEHSVCESIRYYLSLKDRTSKKICNKIKELLEEDCDELTDDILEKISDDDLLNNYLCNCDFSDSEDEE